MSVETRIKKMFDTLKAESRGGLGVFITAGDPDYDTSLEIMKGLPGAGADMIEFGMPFSDPMADGPAIQVASQRSLANGQNMKKTLAMVTDFRSGNDVTPIILMGYYNPIYSYGVDAFLKDAKAAGIDGLIIVDLPPEEENELCLPALKAGINFIYLTAPTTSDERLPRVLEHASGFIYYVSITGITGTASTTAADIKPNIDRIRASTDIPLAVGFGIKTAENVADFNTIADAAIVGTAVVNVIAENLDENNAAKSGLIDKVLGFVRDLSEGTK
ncbi:MAG: tryptophan synthase subunit alpha [Rhodospirillales bacterium]|jgi:tryptophan synthase alpha chain|nr:tryptophan synthase subunit alpha [Rhodospirillales bacterium]